MSQERHHVVNRRIASLALVSVLVALSGCSNESTAPGNEPISPDASSPSASPVGNEPPVEKAAAAPDLPAEAYNVTHRLPIRRGETSFGLLGIGPQAEQLVSASRQPVDGPLNALHQTTLRLRSAKGERSVSIRTPKPRRPQQALGADLNARHVVWMETPSVDLGIQPWTLYAYDRKTRRVEVLAQSPTVGGRPAPPTPGFTGPKLDGDHVFWAEVHGSDSVETVDIMGCRISRCSPRTYLRDSVFPATGGGYLYGITMKNLVRGKNERMTIQQVSLKTGERRVVKRVRLQGRQGPGGLVASPAGVGWITTRSKSEKGSLTVIDHEGRQLQKFSEIGGENFGYPIMTDRFIAWAEGSGDSPAEIGGYLFDFETKKRWAIGNASGLYGIEGSGSTIAWQEARVVEGRGEIVSYVVADLN